MNENTQYYYPCQYGDHSWQSTITITHVSPNYLSCYILGLGSCFTLHVGKHVDTFWVCLPIQEKATTISYLSDVFWNFEVLSSLLDNGVEATTIAYALNMLAGHVS